MKILLSSDYHGDKSTAGFRRIDDVAKAARWTVELAVERKVDWWGFLGDLCDPDFSAVGTLQSVQLSLEIAESLGRVGINNFWIPGNHDVVEDGSGGTTLSPLAAAAFPKTHVFEDPFTNFPLGPGVVLHPLPFVPRCRTYDPDKVVRDSRTPGDDQTIHVFAAHLQVEGATFGSETHDMPRGRDVAFPVEAVKLYPRRICLCGHYHKRQRVGEVMIPGSLEKLTFGEETNETGAMILEV